jgi:hypothetical protein
VGLNDGAFFSRGHYRLYFGLGSSRLHGTCDDSLAGWPGARTQGRRRRSVAGDQAGRIGGREVAK